MAGPLGLLGADLSGLSFSTLEPLLQKLTPQELNI